MNPIMTSQISMFTMTSEDSVRNVVSPTMSTMYPEMYLFTTTGTMTTRMSVRTSPPMNDLMPLLTPIGPV